MTKGLLIFTAGAVTGGLITWQLLKDKYEQRIQDEVKSVQETWERRHSEPSKPAQQPVESDAKEKALAAREKPGIMEYAAKLQNEGYVNYSEMSKPAEEAPKTTEADTDENDIPEEEESIVDEPYVITPGEFGEKDDYDIISLTYYADEVLTDEENELVDVENTVGYDSLTHFGEYEDDSVFVRNDRRRTDYEILKDYREYSDVVRRTGRRVED